MRILLDECVDEALRNHFTGHDCQTCRYAGLRGKTNGELLAVAEQVGFDVLITVDQNMRYQQTLRGSTISLLVRQARTTLLEDLVVLMPNVLAALEVLKSGDVVLVGSQ